MVPHHHLQPFLLFWLLASRAVDAGGRREPVHRQPWALLDSAVAAGNAVGAGLPDPFILSGHSAGGGGGHGRLFINNPQANIPDLKGS